MDTNGFNRIYAFSPNANEFLEYCRCLGVPIPGWSLFTDDQMTKSISVESIASFETLADFMDTNKCFLHRVFPGQMQILLVTMGMSISVS